MSSQSSQKLNKNPLDLSGRTVLVTGASSGIGRQTAVVLSELGARVVLTARTEARLNATLALLSEGANHQVAAADLSKCDEIPKWLQSVCARTGPLHGIVHSAGKQATTPVRFATEAKIDDVIRTNLHSAIMLARGFTQKGCFAPGGSLVFISSVTAFAGKPAISIYGASKAALIGLTKSLAVELAPQGIRVNCIAPAFVKTEMFDQVREMLTDEQLQALEAAHPLGFGTPEDVAHAAAFLLADTGRWITGSTLVVDGGYSAQ